VSWLTAAAFLFFPPEQNEAVEKLVHDMVERAIAMEGTVTGEHGVGVVKRDYLEKELGVTAVDLMRQVRRPDTEHPIPSTKHGSAVASDLLVQIKRAFDPLCLLNCDKVVRMKPAAGGASK